MIIEGIYLGPDHYLGYRTMRKYRLKVNGNTIRDINHQGLGCPYSTLEAFLRNWSEVKVVKEVNNTQAITAPAPQSKKKLFLTRSGVG